MGGVKNIRQEDRPDESVVCINALSEHNSDLSLASVEFRLTLDSDENVLLDDFFFKIKFSANYVCHICSISSESFLVTEYSRKSIRKINTLYPSMLSLELPGYPLYMCELDQSQVAVCLDRRGLNKEIFIIGTDQDLRSLSYFSIHGRCKGIAYVDNLLYVGGGNNICAYTLEGEEVISIPQNHRPDNFIMQMTKGPNSSIICLSESITQWACDIVDVNGILQRTLSVLNENLE